MAPFLAVATTGLMTCTTHASHTDSQVFTTRGCCHKRRKEVHIHVKGAAVSHRAGLHADLVNPRRWPASLRRPLPHKVADRERGQTAVAEAAIVFGLQGTVKATAAHIQPASAGHVQPL